MKAKGNSDKRERRAQKTVDPGEGPTRGVGLLDAFQGGKNKKIKTARATPIQSEGGRKTGRGE